MSYDASCHYYMMLHTTSTYYRIRVAGQNRMQTPTPDLGHRSGHNSVVTNGTRFEHL
jgi:hypothetical protein